MSLRMERFTSFPGKAFRVLRTYLRYLWLRVLVMGALAILAVAGAPLVTALSPEAWTGRLTLASTNRLLDLIATAMLAVTTFSLTVMVSVYRASATQFTPRLHQLIRADPTTQNTLATFIGAYVYALVAIVLTEMGYYRAEAAPALFAVTVLVLGLIVWSFVRWMEHLQTLGSLIHATRQIEEMTCRQFEERLDTPCLGARPFTGDAPADGTTLRAPASGYVQLLHPDALQALAEEHDLEIWVLCDVGDFVFEGDPVLCVTGAAEIDDTLEQAMLDNLVCGDERTFDQDPRFGLLAMSEIGSKALSPGINDPGSAIDVLNRLGRILSRYRDETENGETPLHPRLYIRPLAPGALIDDAFAGIARDGATLIEVQHRLQRVLGALTHHRDPALGTAARDQARLFLDRAREAMPFAPDRDKLLAVADPEVHDP